MRRKYNFRVIGFLLEKNKEVFGVIYLIAPQIAVMVEFGKMSIKRSPTEQASRFQQKEIGVGGQEGLLISARKTTTAQDLNNYWQPPPYLES
jgi:hypothetical protein